MPSWHPHFPRQVPARAPQGGLRHTIGHQAVPQNGPRGTSVDQEGLGKHEYVDEGVDHRVTPRHLRTRGNTLTLYYVRTKKATDI